MSAFAAIRNLPWTPPTKAVPAPVALLAAAKEAGVDLPAEFVVRMPTAADAAFVNEAESRAQNMAAMLETFAANGLQDKADALKAAILHGDPAVQSALMLCDMRGRFLFEARPDLFPQGRLTVEEMALWSMYYEEKHRERK